MGTLLLILAMSGMAAAGLWAALGRKGEDEKPPFYALDKEAGGAKSSPDLPSGTETQQAGSRGEPVVLGGGPEDAERIREYLEGDPEKIDALMQSSEDRRRKQEAEEEAARQRGPIDLTYDVDELISRSSPYAHHRRTLQNAENLADKRKGDESKALFERAKNRIDEEEINQKIGTNIEDIERWIAGGKSEEEETRVGGDAPFADIAVPVAAQLIALDNLTAGLRVLAESIVEQLARMPLGAVQAGAVTSTGPVTLTGPVSFLAPADGAPAMTPGSPGAAPYGIPPGIKIEKGRIHAKKRKAKEIGAPPPTPDTGVYSSPEGFDMLGWSTGDMANLPPGLSVNERGEIVTDGWTDADFDREWEKYKNLPLKDRRLREDRRKKIDRRIDKRKDRRSGLERRQKNLFKEREEFLAKLEKHKENKRLLDEFRRKKADQAVQPEIAFKTADIEIEELETEEPRLPEPAPSPAPEKKEERDEKPQTLSLEPAPLPSLDDLRFPEAEEKFDEPELPDIIEPGPEEEAEGPIEGEGVESVEGFPESDEEEESEEEKPAPQEIHGVLELKPPEEDDAPFLTLTYDFGKIPDSFQLSQDYNTMEYAYYRYKPMLIKAQEFTRRKMLKNALNYYRVVKSQSIPPELKRMINRNINDITEYLEKYLLSRG